MIRPGRQSVLILALLAAACAPTTVAQPVRTPAAPTFSTLGLEGVMGRTAPTLVNQFGTADLDVREGGARKLQFSGPICVLDAYLYPPKGGGDPIVTYIDTRLPDGRDIDRASCVAALGRAPK